jgi:transcriptional regulator with XRE-family HTH domain
MKFNYKDFAKAIINNRFEISYKSKRNFGLRGIAKSCGVSASTLSRVINGKKADIDTILAICSWLKTDIAKFISKNK